MTQDCPLDPTRDLFLERIVELPPKLIWKSWTTPELITQWFTPAPWTTPECEIDLRPGGLFRTLMRSPEGMEVTNRGCYLELIPNERLVWTNAMDEGFRPASCPPDLFLFTAIISLEAHDKGTKYTARVVHQDEESCQRHNRMGFHEGWNAALDQLIALAKTLWSKSAKNTGYFVNRSIPSLTKIPNYFYEFTQSHRCAFLKLTILKLPGDFAPETKNREMVGSLSGSMDCSTAKSFLKHELQF